MNLIVAADRNWGIGNKGQLLVSIPADLKMFRQKTLNKVIVYGRKTLETFPLAQPLDRRENIILSTKPGYTVRNAKVAHSIPELMEMLAPYPGEEIFVIGGASVYRQLLPYCSTAYVTKLDYSYEADAFFPDLDADPDWELKEESEEYTYFNIPYAFTVYQRK